MSTMTEVLIRPLDHLVFRSGRPFGSTQGADQPAAIPCSAIAGAIRSAHVEKQAAENTLGNYGDPKVQDSLKKLVCHGPLLLRASPDASPARSWEPLFSRPADALYLRDEGAEDATLVTLSPGEIDADLCCDLDENLLPVFAPQGVVGKPVDGLSAWTLETMCKWLLNGSVQSFSCTDRKFGEMNIPDQVRTHNAILHNSNTTVDGVLFQTLGLDFSDNLALLVRTSTSELADLRTLGGEGRLVHLVTEQQLWPSMPPAIADRLKATVAGSLPGIRMVLATGAVFENGYLPGWLDVQGNGMLTGSPPGFEGRLELRLRAVANERWQAESGWDIRKRAPRPVRRIVPAGSVYWFEVLHGDAQALIDLWLQPVSDEDEHRRNGYGLALVGLWHKKGA